MDLVVFRMAFRVSVRNPIYFVVLFFNLANVDLLGEVGGTFVWAKYPVDILVVKSVERNFFSFLINLL